jgi:hypothetical protein
MKTQEILSIVALGLLGVCLLCGLAKMAMKGDKAKQSCDKACSMAIFAAVVLVGVSQLLTETEKYSATPSPSSETELGKFLSGKGHVCIGNNANPKHCYIELNNIQGIMSQLNIPSYMDNHKNMNCPSGRPGVKPEFHDVLYQEGDQNVIFSCKYPGGTSSLGECELLQNNIGTQCPSYIPLVEQDPGTISTAVWCGGVEQGGVAGCASSNAAGIKQYIADSQGAVKKICCTCPRWPCVPGAPKSFLPKAIKESPSCPTSMKECPKPEN